MCDAIIKFTASYTVLSCRINPYIVNVKVACSSPPLCHNITTVSHHDEYNNSMSDTTTLTITMYYIAQSISEPARYPARIGGKTHLGAMFG
jgi:hypothetical protein